MNISLPKMLHHPYRAAAAMRPRRKADTQGQALACDQDFLTVGSQGVALKTQRQVSGRREHGSLSRFWALSWLTLLAPLFCAWSLHSAGRSGVPFPTHSPFLSLARFLPKPLGCLLRASLRNSFLAWDRSKSRCFQKLKHALYPTAGSWVTGVGGWKGQGSCHRPEAKPRVEPQKEGEAPHTPTAHGSNPASVPGH